VPTFPLPHATSRPTSTPSAPPSAAGAPMTQSTPSAMVAHVPTFPLPHATSRPTSTPPVSLSAADAPRPQNTPLPPDGPRLLGQPRHSSKPPRLPAFSAECEVVATALHSHTIVNQQPLPLLPTPAVPDLASTTATATVPGAPAAAAAGAPEWGDVPDTPAEALGPDGRGWVLLTNAIPSEIANVIHRGTFLPSAADAQPIINSQEYDAMVELGEAADRGRRQVVVPPEGGRFENAVRGVLDAVASHVGGELNAPYDGVTPHVLITMPRAPAQLAHTDAGLYVAREGSGTLLSIYVSVEEGTGVDVWSNVFGEAGEGLESSTLPAPERVVIPVGGCLIVRHDLVHRGTSNLRGRAQLRCLHAYLAVPVNGTHMAYADHMSFLTRYV